MKKTYQTPTLIKRERLSSVTAGSSASIILPPPPLT
ncbi:putative RiPP precursor [Mesorhizobium sp. B2-3-12]|nr:putative RiPP precursor [Mesorhizobium sp. B2-3-12]